MSQAKYEADLSSNTALPGDLVFTQRGTLGQVAVVPAQPHQRYVISQSQMRLRVDESRFDARFVYYACSTSEFARQVDDNAIRTGVPHINLGILARLELPAPSLKVQRGIAEVLGALDDKIAANTRILDVADEFVRASYSALKLEGREGRKLGALATNVRAKAAPGSVAPDSVYVLSLIHI